MFLWCHKEIDGTIGTYPYRKVSDELQRIIHDHGIDDVKVLRVGKVETSTAGNRRRLPNGDIVWLDKEAPAPWKPSDTLFSLNYPYDWGEGLFQDICKYFVSIPNLNGRWEVKIVDCDTRYNWHISATEETYDFLSDHWAKIPDSDPMFLSECTAEQVKEWLLDNYEWRRRDHKTTKKTHSPSRAKWLYIEEGNIVRKFYEKSDLAQYIYTSDTPKQIRLKREW